MWTPERIQNLLDHLNWSKAQLARAIGTSPGRIAHWLNGNNPNRSFQIALDHVAEKYNFGK